MALYATTVVMTTKIYVRELRNSVSKVLQRVESGESVTVLVGKRPVAEIVPLSPHRAIPASKALEVASRHSADPGLRSDLRRLMTDTTDDI